MKSVILSYLLCALPVLGDSYFNPWFSFKVELNITQGEKFSSVVKDLLESASTDYPVQFELFLKDTKFIYSAVNEFELRHIIEKRKKPFGLILSEIAENSNIHFLVDPKSVIFVPADYLEYYDLFYLLPEKMKWKFEGKSAKEVFANYGLKNEEGTIMDVDSNYSMMRLRGNSVSHAALRKILNDWHAEK